MSWPSSGRVAARTDRVAGRVTRYAARRVVGPPVTIQSLYRNTSPCRARTAHHVALCRACRSSLLPIVAHCYAVSQPLVRCVATSSLLLLSRYNHLYRATPQQPDHARVRYRSPRAQVGRVAVPTGRVVVVSCLAVRTCCATSQALPITIKNIVS